MVINNIIDSIPYAVLYIHVTVTSYSIHLFHLQPPQHWPKQLGKNLRGAVIWGADGIKSSGLNMRNLQSQESEGVNLKAQRECRAGCLAPGKYSHLLTIWQILEYLSVGRALYPSPCSTPPFHYRQPPCI